MIGDLNHAPSSLVDEQYHAESKLILIRGLDLDGSATFFKLNSTGYSIIQTIIALSILIPLMPIFETNGTEYDH